MKLRKPVLLVVVLGTLAAAGCGQAAPQPVPPAATASPVSPTLSLATLSITADPSGAQIAIDGQSRGASPVDLALAPGTHQVHTSAPGFAALTEVITLTAGEQAMYSPTLTSIVSPTVALSADPRRVPWLGETHVHATASGKQAIALMQLLFAGQVIAEGQVGELTTDLEPAEIEGLAPGQAYTLTARAQDQAGNTGEASLTLQVMPEPTVVASPLPSATTQKTPTLTPTLPAPATLTPTLPALQSAPSSVTLTPTMTPTVPTPTPRPVAATTYTVTTISIPTYPYSGYLRTVPDPNLDDYPLLVLDRSAYQASHPRPVPVSYTLIVLENRYLRLTLLPQLGGRIYQCIFKPTGNNELYQNPVIKPTVWGPPPAESPAGANWWLAVGGLEWGFPVDEHGYEWGRAWGYDYTQGSDGSVTVTMIGGDVHRPYVTVAVTLPPDSAAFTVQPTIVNPLSTTFNYKWWEDAMTAPGRANKPGPNVRFIVPGSEVTVHTTDDNTLPPAGAAMSWPTFGGRDMSRLGTWRGWLGFFARPWAQAGFSAVYDPSADEGFVHVFPPDVERGVKGFGAGWSTPLDPSIWTDDGSGYVELHGGLAPTFADWNSLVAGGQITWDETWFPAAGIGGVAYASANGAVNVSRTVTGTQVSVFPARPLGGRLDITVPGADPFSRTVQIGPDQPFQEAIASVADQGMVAVTLTDDEGQALIKYQGQLP
jgi:hypothetical protein